MHYYQRDLAFIHDRSFARVEEDWAIITEYSACVPDLS